MKVMKDLNNKQFSMIKRGKSFTHAWRGFFLFIKITHNAWVEIASFILGFILACYFHISANEWTILILASGFIFATEAINTALEIDMDLTSPEFHPFARDVKDIAASAVLISTVIGIIVSIIIFGHYII